MNIWIDLDNSPHVPFFVPIIRELERRGHSVTLTARDAFQVYALAELFGLEYKRVGRHYGKHKALKAFGLCLRTLRLFPTTLSEKLDLAVSHGSRSQTLAALARGIPNLVIFDYEFAKSLVVFRPTWVMVPDVIPDSAVQFDPHRILHYPGIKEDVYVPGFTPHPSIKTQLGLNGDSVVVTVRPPANEAHYHCPESDGLFSATMDWLGRAPGVKTILLPRNARQEAAVRKTWAKSFSIGKFIVPGHAVDGLNLIWYSDLVISGGGTMNREAAALGVPVYSIFRGRIGAVDRYLADHGRLVLLENSDDLRTKLALCQRPRPSSPPVVAADTLNAIVDSILGVCAVRSPNRTTVYLAQKNGDAAWHGNEPSKAYSSAKHSANGFQSASSVLADYFRCTIDGLHAARTPTSSAHSGYFRLGLDTICYGRLASGHTARQPAGVLDDALDAVQIESSGVKLPFDPADVIENLRRERYASAFHQPDRFSHDAVRKAYYLLRPVLPLSARKYMQKARLRDWTQLAFPAWPVDATVERIHRKLLALSLQAQVLKQVPFIWFWPDGYSSCAILTHDVESLMGRDFCSAVMDLDESFGFRSAFQVVPEKRYPVPRSFLESIANRGFELNVHDLNHDGRLFADHGEFRRRVIHINRYAREFGAQGFRSGALYRNADWYERFDFSYDMSLPNVAHLDAQRGGCCTVMPYFIGNIVELPVTCSQDYTLFHILGDYSADLWKKQVSLVRANHGLISVIVHPDYIREKRAQGIYRQLLSHLAELRDRGDIWSVLPKEVAAWWRRRSKMELIHKNGRWRVEGEGCERARVAYATLQGDEVIYSWGPGDVP